MGFEQACRIVYYIILIMLTLIILITFLWPQWRNNTVFNSNIEVIEDDDENNVLDNNDDNLFSNHNHNFESLNYRKDQQILTLNDQPFEKNTSIEYTDFLELIENPRFLEQYCNSLKRSFCSKKKIYTKKIKQLEADLKIAQSKQGGFGVIGHDTSLERIQRNKVEIDQILSYIEYRLKHVNVETVRNDLKIAVYDKENGLDGLIGRKDVKDFMALQIYTFGRNPDVFFTTFQNITIYGKSGVGKTKLAETIAHVYAKSGILIRKKYRNVTKQEFTSSYVNESPQLTRELLLSTLEGVLFIDEAYDLTPPKTMFGRNVDHGQEAVTEMVNFLDKNIGLSVVIAAGYEEEMIERFMGSNQGLDRRFPHNIRLEDYDSRQLTEILLKFMAKSGPTLKIGNSEAGYIYNILDFLVNHKPGIFDKQAGDMLTLSGYIIRSIYGSRNYIWQPDNFINNKIMVLDGVNDYLRTKGISISPKMNF
jgi:SpoVK/Ycf46/Vps4 family AAA+-type ATPase